MLFPSRGQLQNTNDIGIFKIVNQFLFKIGKIRATHHATYYRHSCQANVLIILKSIKIVNWASTNPSFSTRRTTAWKRSWNNPMLFKTNTFIVINVVFIFRESRMKLGSSQICQNRILPKTA